MRQGVMFEEIASIDVKLRNRLLSSMNIVGPLNVSKKRIQFKEFTGLTRSQQEFVSYHFHDLLKSMRKGVALKSLLPL